jgi:hypothetical protein
MTGYNLFYLLGFNISVYIIKAILLLIFPPISTDLSITDETRVKVVYIIFKIQNSKIISVILTFGTRIRHFRKNLINCWWGSCCSISNCLRSVL